MFFLLVRETFEDDFAVEYRADTIEEAREWKEKFIKAGLLVTIVQEVE